MDRSSEVPALSMDAPLQTVGAAAYRRIIDMLEWQLKESAEHAKRMQEHAIRLQGELDDARQRLREHGIII